MNEPTKGGLFFPFHYSFFCIIKHDCHFQQKKASVEQYMTWHKSKSVAHYFKSLVISQTVIEKKNNALYLIFEILLLFFVVFICRIFNCILLMYASQLA